jgi:NADH-quinone oxidoreductase subunit D
VALPAVHAALASIKDALDEQPGLDAHLDGLGRLRRADALSCGVTGPALRACGVPDDLRVHEPAFAYAELMGGVVTAESGCARARSRVRLEESIASIGLIGRALERLPAAGAEWRMQDAPWPDAGDAPAPPPGTAVAALEAPSGELCCSVVSDGSERPRRVRVRGPSAPLFAALPELLAGARIDDVVPVLLGLGLVGTEIDR